MEVFWEVSNMKVYEVWVGGHDLIGIYRTLEEAEKGQNETYENGYLYGSTILEEGCDIQEVEMTEEEFKEENRYGKENSR
jgi:hypothetical protein